MKLLPAITATITIFFALTGAAYAGNTRVVVAAPEADAIANRLEKELTAMGYEAVRVDAAPAVGCSRPAVEHWVEDQHAAGAACSDGSTVGIWVVGPSGLRMADDVGPEDPAKPAPDLIALRAAEITRATIELPPAEPAPTAPTAPVGWKTTLLDIIRDSAPPPPPRKIEPPHTPLASIGAGFGALTGTDASAPTADVEAQLRLHRFVALSGRAEVPLQSTNIHTQRANVTIAPAVFALGASFALAPADSFFIPRLGSGIGVVWLRSEATAPDRNADIFSPMVYANATTSFRLAGPCRLAFDALVGSTAYRMVVRDDLGQHIAYWGQPFASLALRGEVVFQ